ncbi:uncharacterized protein LOC143281308 [Babylonia areolata]|uniref:uncharacterized protein LOC143281308 n=1 Tax=Babylonia areolata TaxID=304850 RepID=UPI003FD0B1C4
MVSPADKCTICQGQIDYGLFWGDLETPSRREDFRKSVSTDVDKQNYASFKQCHYPDRCHNCQPSRNPTVELSHAPALKENHTCKKTESGISETNSRTDLHDNSEVLKKVSGKSIFFSKYFPGNTSEESAVTHLHWKKVMSGMSADKGSTPLADSSSIAYNSSDEAGSNLAHDSSYGTNALYSFTPQNSTAIRDHDNDANRSVDHPLLRNDNAGFAQVTEKCRLEQESCNSSINHPCSNKNMSNGFERKELLTCGKVHCSKADSSTPEKPVGFARKGTDFRHQKRGLQEGAVSSVMVNRCIPRERSPTHLQPNSRDVDKHPTISSSECSNGGERQRKTNRVHSATDPGDAYTCGGDWRVETPSSTEVPGKAAHFDSGQCQVCEDTAAGFYCGAFVCEACKKFFIRASKQEKQKFVCLRDSLCKITKESRVQCQFCRYQKCLKLNMNYPGEGKRSVSGIHVSGIPCRVCGSPSSGFHFGALTCEGCKGFFRRMVKEREPGMYKCSTGGHCEISMNTRNMCKACRYQKCINNGMSMEGSRIGRQPNAVKHAISLEVKKQRLELSLEQTAVSLVSSDNQRQMVKEETDTVDTAGAMPCPSTAGPAPLGGLSAATTVEEKDESEATLSLSDVVFTEVHPGVVVKQEPENEQIDEKITESLYAADKELSNMCAVSRAKMDALDKSEFESYPIMWKKQMKHFNFHAQCCIRFSKRIPGFKDILLDDKVALVQNAIYSIVVLNHARHYELDTGFYNFFNFSKREEEVVLQMCPGYTTLQMHFRHMGVIAQTMQMTRMEFILLSCLLLCDPECPGLVAPGQVVELQTLFMNYFHNYEMKTHPNGPVRLGEMLLRISELKLASEQHIQTISGFLSTHPELELPQMFREMFF